MAIKDIKAEVNGKSYKLAHTTGDNYSTDIEALEKSGQYGISVTATDEAGNATTIDSTDERFGKKLVLRVKDTLETADIRRVILTNELGDWMLDTVAPIYDYSKLTLSTFEAFGETLTQEVDFVSGDFISQIFPQTVTWAIRLWENEFGIIPDTSKPLNQRRQNLMNAMYKHIAITPWRVEKMIYAITGFEGKAVENTAPNTMTIFVFGYVRNLQPLKKELNSKLPAHLSYTISMFERESIEAATYSGFGVHEFESINVEVNDYIINIACRENIDTATYSGFGIHEFEAIKMEVND